MSRHGRSRRKQKNRRQAGILPILLVFVLLIGGTIFFGVYWLNRETLTQSGAKQVQETAAMSPEAEDKAAIDAAAADGEDEYTGNEMQEFVISADDDDDADGEDGSVIGNAEETEAETQPPKYDSSDGSRAITQADPETVTITFAGDILFDPAYAVMASMLQRSGSVPDITTAFDSQALSLMRNSDIFMVNNEFPYSKRGEPLPEKTFTFRADPKYVSLLNDIGADIVSLANNHVNDHGKTAMLDTFDTIDGAGIARVGAGHNIAEASAPVFFTNGDIKIGFLSATQIERMGNPDTVGAGESSPGVFRCMNVSLLQQRIRETKQVCDYVIVYIHWGTEGTDQTDSWQEKQAVEIADAGADLIIGDHPHVLQKIGKANGVPVVFSLGNYLFNSKTLDTCLVQVTLDAKTAERRSFRFIPAIQSGCRTKLAENEEKERILAYMRSLSRGMDIDADGYISFQ